MFSLRPPAVEHRSPSCVCCPEQKSTSDLNVIQGGNLSSMTVENKVCLKWWYAQLMTCCSVSYFWLCFRRKNYPVEEGVNWAHQEEAKLRGENQFAEWIMWYFNSFAEGPFHDWEWLGAAKTIQRKVTDSNFLGWEPFDRLLVENIRVEWEVSYPSRTFATSTKRSLFYKYLGMGFTMTCQGRW